MSIYIRTHTWLSLLILCSFISVSAQSLDRKVFAAQGGNTTSGPYYFSFTIGEVVIGTDNNNLPILTKGFEQPIDPTLLEIIRRQELEEGIDFQYKIYPNPAITKVTFSYSSDSDAPKQVRLVNALGQVLFHEDFESQSLQEGAIIDLAPFPTGTYWLICSDLGKKSIFPLRKE